MAIALWALLLPSASFSFGLSGATLSARPTTIKAGLFFAGETVTVAGQKPAGEPLLILVVGPQQEQIIAQLVKQQGIWLTGKQQTLTNAPGFLAAAGTDPLPDLFKLFSPAMSRNHLTGISAFFATPEAASA
ncbi:MAG: TIGR02186 family protein, partial [Gammaproteobacteria bacterium]